MPEPLRICNEANYFQNGVQFKRVWFVPMHGRVHPAPSRLEWLQSHGDRGLSWGSRVGSSVAADPGMKKCCLMCSTRIAPRWECWLFTALFCTSFLYGCSPDGAWHQFGCGDGTMGSPPPALERGMAERGVLEELLWKRTELLGLAME